MGYTRDDIERARVRQGKLAGKFHERMLLNDGAMDFKIDARLFHNARLSEQRDHGVENCWQEREFVSDMKRRHPEIAVKSLSRKLRFRIEDGEWRNSEQIGKLTRFGRVTCHKTYA